MVAKKANVVESLDYSKMAELEGIAYTGYVKEKDLPIHHLADGLFRLARRGVLARIDSSTYLHKQTGTYWIHSSEVVEDGVIREVVDLRHPSKSSEVALVAQHECLGDLASLLVGIKGL